MSEVVDAHDVRVVQPGHRTRFAHQSFFERGVFPQVRVHDSDGDRPIELAMSRLVDGAHPTGTDQLEVIELGKLAAQFFRCQRCAARTALHMARAPSRSPHTP